MSDNISNNVSTTSDLFSQYASLDDEVVNAQRALAEAMKKRSVVVERIGQTIGKGPFEHKGKLLGTIICRDGTWFFRAPQNKPVVKV